MSIKLPVEEQDIDALVREYLETSAAEVDVARLEREIAARLNAVQSTEPASRAWHLAPWLRRSGAWITAACVLVAVSVSLYFTLQPGPASAYSLVSAAHQSLDKGPDRCYLVEGRLPEAWLRANPIFRVGEHATVWTRGDRFVVSADSAEHAVHWGQDEARNFWLVAGHTGFSFRPGETPPILNRTRMYLSLNPRQLLNRFLNEYDLTIIKDRQGATAPIVRIWATRKAEAKAAVFDAAWLEIDPRTKLIRRLEVERQIGKRSPPYGLVFTLVDQAVRQPGDYQAEHYLPPGGELLGPDRASERDRRFWELLGRRPGAARPQLKAESAPVDSQ